MAARVSRFTRRREEIERYFDSFYRNGFNCEEMITVGTNATMMFRR